MNYYEHHLGDYLRDTAHLSMIEDGAYRRLMDAYYIAEGPFPDDKRELMKLCRAVTKAERDAVEYVLKKFFNYEAGSGWAHSRCEREIARYKAKQEKAKASADARWSAQRSHSERNANASPEHDAQDMRTHSPSNANGMHRAPVPSNQTPDTKHQAPIPPLPPSGGKRATRLPADWALPKSWGEWALSEQPSWTAEHCRKAAASFADYWQAKPGKDATKLDWEKTWHGWVRREGPMRVQGAGFQQPSGPASPSASPEIAKTRALLESQQLSPEQIEANRSRAAEIRAQLKAVG